MWSKDWTANHPFSVKSVISATGRFGRNVVRYFPSWLVLRSLFLRWIYSPPPPDTHTSSCATFLHNSTLRITGVPFHRNLTLGSSYIPSATSLPPDIE